jgi:uncharacterized protein (UPF0335 family)
MSKKDDLDLCLERVLNVIVSGLKKPLTALFDEEWQKVVKEVGLEEKTKKIESKKAEIKKLQEEVKDLEAELSLFDGDIYKIERIQDDQPKEIEESGGILWEYIDSYGLTKTKQQAIFNIINSQHAKNVLNFEKIKKDLYNTWSLCVSKKERRGIIIQLQNRDWSQLGIDLPDFAYFSEFKIENGGFSLPRNRSLPSPIEEI